MLSLVTATSEILAMVASVAGVMDPTTHTVLLAGPVLSDTGAMKSGVLRKLTVLELAAADLGLFFRFGLFEL